MQWIRGAIFVFQMYLMMPIMGLLFFPLALASPRGAAWACHTYTRWVIWTARWMVGIRTDVRGPVPQDEVLVAAKHQSFFDIIVIFNALPRSKFIMKMQIFYTPIIGQYSYRLGCIPVRRGKRGQAIKKMIADVKAGKALPGQVVIYPQGTRVAPGVKAPYKVGAAVLYRELEQPCVPVATNVGVFWPKRGFRRKPGVAVVEFLDPIAPGLDSDAFMEELETRIETRSQALLEEAQ